MRIADLYFYPIKGFRGLRIDRMELQQAGPLYDREWLLIDENRVAITLRTLPALTTIGLEIVNGASLALTRSDLGETEFGLEEREGDAFEVRIWDDVVPAFEVSSEVSMWLSSLFKQKVRLVKLSPEARRRFSVKGEDRFPERTIRFVDQKPLLVISRASMNELERRMGEDALIGQKSLSGRTQLSVHRFRPNIVIDEVGTAHAEDGWSGFTAGGLRFEALKACTRCKVTTVHPLTGQVGVEPLKTLSTYRRGPKGVEFGFYYAHLSDGVIRVGDPVHVF